MAGLHGCRPRRHDPRVAITLECYLPFLLFLPFSSHRPWAPTWRPSHPVSWRRAAFFALTGLSSTGVAGGSASSVVVGTEPRSTAPLSAALSPEPFVAAAREDRRRRGGPGYRQPRRARRPRRCRPRRRPPRCGSRSPGGTRAPSSPAPRRSPPYADCGPCARPGPGSRTRRTRRETPSRRTGRCRPRSAAGHRRRWPRSSGRRGGRPARPRAGTCSCAQTVGVRRGVHQLGPVVRQGRRTASAGDRRARGMRARDQPIVVGRRPGRLVSNVAMASACRSVRPMSSRPSSRRQRV